jgi:uncharacterized protein
MTADAAGRVVHRDPDRVADDDTVPPTFVAAATVVDLPDRSRYEALDGHGRPFGRADYRAEDGRLVVPHVEVEPRLQGQGLGGWLVQHVLDDARARGLTVVPVCPYVRLWIRQHPAYADLVHRPGSA